MTERVIYCAGEQGRVTLSILRASGDDDGIVFADDDPAVHGETHDGVPIVGGIELASDVAPDAPCIVAFGDRPGVRLDLAESAAREGFEFFSAIHPDTTVSETAAIGSGTTVNAQSYLGPNARLGDHVLVDSCVNLSHDVDVDDGATVTPGATLAGGVNVRADSYVGPGATVVEDVTVGAEAVVGAGAVVTEDIPPEKTVVGVPAAPIED